MTKLPIKPAYKDNLVAVTCQSSEYYAPFTSVTLQSIINNASRKYNYDIVIVTLDMTEQTAERICSLADEKNNITIRVINLMEYYKKYDVQKIAGSDNRFGGITICRLFYPEVFGNYTKIVSIEADMLFCADIADLYNTDLDGYYMGAVADIIAVYMYHSGFNHSYLKNAIDGFLELSEPEQYHNAGMMVFNLAEIRKDFTIQEMVDFLKINHCQLYEQDTFNHFFRGRIYDLDLSWNFLIDTKGFVENGRKKYYTKLYEKYLEARKEPRMLHYATSYKPWDKVVCPFFSNWWNVAKMSPFYNQIVNNRIERKNGDKPTRLLFVCETTIQLINSMNIKICMYPNVEADIAFTSSTDFSQYIDRVKALGIFANIYHSDYCVSEDYYKFKKNAPNKAVLSNPSKYELAFPLTEKYSDYFMAVSSSPIQKLTYYQIVKMGKAPCVHIYEEGSDTYITNIHKTIACDMFDHTVYPERDRLENNILELMFYEPILYCGGDMIPVSVIPKIDERNTTLIDAMHKIFGECKLPKEKYIFFNECFATDRLPSDDMEILDRIADKVGVDNITVKVHPRGKNEEVFYRMHGYSIFAEKTIPWEVFVLSAEIENKILISVSSNTIINPSVIFNKNVNVIFLWKAMILSRRSHVKNPTYQKFFNKTLTYMNAHDKLAFCPKNIDELDIIIDYLEGKL